MFGFGKSKLGARNTSSSDDIDFSEFDDMDFNFDGADAEDSGRKATLTSKLKEDVAGHLSFLKNDAKLRRELMKKALPSDYTPVLESYDTVSNEVASLWRDQQKEWEKVRKDVKNTVKAFSSVTDKLGLKRLSAWANEEERSSSGAPSEDQLDELKIQSILDETFGAHMQAQNASNEQRQKVDDERFEADMVDKEQSAERQNQGNKLLEGINKGIIAQRSFNEQITYTFQRKSIELQARTFVTQQRQLQLLSAYRKESMEELQAIHKNTGLPDYLKINASEIAQQALAQKVMGGIMAPFDGVGSQLTKRVVGKIRGKMSNFWQEIGSNLSMFNDNTRDSVEDGGTAAGHYGALARQMGLGMGIDKLVGKGADWLSPKIRAQMEKRGWDVYGSNLSALTAQAPTLINKGLKNGFGNNLIDGLVDFFDLRDAAISGDRTAYNAKDLDLEKAAFMDNRFRLTVIDIIPGWLKKIHMNTYRAAHGKDAKDVSWDFKSGDFVDTKKLEDNMMDEVVKKDQVQQASNALDEWLNAFDKNHLLSAKAVGYIKKWLIKERASSGTMNPLELLTPNFKAPPDVKGELLFKVPKLMNLPEKLQEQLMNSESVMDIAKISMMGFKEYNSKQRELSNLNVNIRKMPVMDEKGIERMAKTSSEGLRFLIKRGAIIETSDGVYSINPNFEEILYGQYTRDYKQNGRLSRDEDGYEIHAIDEDYDYMGQKQKLRYQPNVGTSHQSDAQRANTRLRNIADLHQGGLAFSGMTLGDDYLIHPTTGEYIHSSDSRFDAIKRKQEGTKKFNSFAAFGFDQNQLIANRLGSPWSMGYTAKNATLQSTLDRKQQELQEQQRKDIEDLNSGKKRLAKAARIRILDRIIARNLPDSERYKAVLQSLLSKKEWKKRQDLYAKRGYASGGWIPSFASGGNLSHLENTARLKTGSTKGQPDQEHLVKTHGGEYVVSKDATDFNKTLLESINKLGAPLINSDNTINSVYYRLFGFKSEKEFKEGARLKGLTSKAKEFANEQEEMAVEKIWQALDISTGNFTKEEMASVLNKKLPAKRRLANGMKLWTKQQQAKAKADPKAYASRLGKMGINKLHDKFNRFIDPKGEGTNVEIVNSLAGIGKKIGSDVLSTGKSLGQAGWKSAKNLGMSTKGHLLDRDRTMTAVSQTLKEAENPKMFNLPIDLYFKGKGTPFLTKQGFRNHEYIDQKSGSVIKNPSEVTGTVVDKEGAVIVSFVDLVNNEIVTRAGKPYRMLGLQEANRRYMSATEYAGKRYAILAQSERFRDTLEKAKNARDKFILDKPIDIYDRNGKLLLTAEGFKERRYMDKNTGNILWSHHDITGPVIDVQNKGNVVLTEEQLADGLFNNEKEHVKISKLKQYRNMAFKRTNEVYQKYASKYVNKYGGKALNWMSAMGEKRVGLNYDNNPIDIYIAGETEPRITAAQFKAEKVFCKDKPIKSHSGISGAVMMQNEHGFYIKITVEELPQLVDAMGEKLKLPLMMSATQRFGSYLKEAALPGAKGKAFMNFLKMSGDKRQELFEDEVKKRKIAYDVYIKGNPSTPVLTKKGFESNHYLSQKTGKVITIPEFIDGPVMDTGKQLLITEEDLKKGLMTVDGKPVHINTGEFEGLFGGLRRHTQIMKRIGANKADEMITKIEDVRIKGQKDILIKAMDIKSGKYFRADNGKPVKDYADLLAGVKDEKGNTIVSEADLKTGLETVSGKNIQTLAKFKGSMRGLTNFFRKGSWADQRDNAKNKKDKDKDPKEKKEKKESWISKLIKGLMSPFGMILGGLGSSLLGGFGTLLKGSIGWLGSALSLKLGGGPIGSLLGALLPGVGEGKGGKGKGLLGAAKWMLGSTTGRLATAGLAYAGYKGYQHWTGDAEAGDPNTKEDPYKQEPEKGMGSKAWDLVKTYGPYAAMMFPGATWKLAKGIVGGGGKLLGKGAVAGVKGAGQAAAWGATKLATRLPGMAGTLGKVASGAARVGAGTWAGTGAMIRGGITAASWLLKGARLLTPWGIAATIAWYGGKALYNMWKDGKNPWNRFRMAQYGFDHNDSGITDKIAKMETIAQSLIQVGVKSVSFKEDQKAVDEILKICGFKDENGQDIAEQQERLPAFSIWFKERFLRVFASYAQTLKQILGKPDIVDLQKLDRDQQTQLLKGVHFTATEHNPYMIKQSPFEDPDRCEMGMNDVEKISRKLRDKISQLPKPPEKAKALTATEDAPLDANKKGKSEADKAVEKQMNKDGKDKPKTPSTKTAVDEANKAVKYQSLAAQAVVKQNREAIVKTTQEANKQTDSLFDKMIDGLTSKIKNFQSAAATAWNKITSGNFGETMDGIGDAAGLAANAVGLGGVYSAGQWLGDQVSSIGGGNAKAAEQNLITTAKKAGITNPTELAMLLSQAAHESNGFKTTREYGKDADFAKYNNRRDLGNGPNDGAKYKGRGYIQLTGKANYAAFSKWAGQDFVSKPELVEKEPWASLATVWFWTQHPNMTKRGRAAAQRGDIIGATKAVNGGLNGLEDRKKYWAKYSQMAKDPKGFESSTTTNNAFTARNASASKEGSSQTSNAFTQRNAPVQPQSQKATTTLPPTIAAPTATNKQAGGIIGNAMASLDAKYGNKSTPTPLSSPTAQKAQAVTTAKVTNAPDWDIDKIAQTVTARSKGPWRQGLNVGKCAEYVRAALQSGDLKGQIKGGFGHAYQLMQALQSLGWVNVGTINTVKPQKGDIACFDRGSYIDSTGKPTPYGHICIFNGTAWISDFTQNQMYPSSKASGAKHYILRAQSQLCKTGAVPTNMVAPETAKASAGTQAIANTPIAKSNSSAKVSQTMNSISNGSASTTSSQTYTPPPQTVAPSGETNVILGKQLVVQEKILSLLEQLVGNTSSTNRSINPNSNSQENSAITKQGLTIPQLEVKKDVLSKPAPVSPFADVTNPISVKKPA